MKAERKSNLLPEWFYEVVDRILIDYEADMWNDPDSVPQWYKDRRKQEHDARTNDGGTEEGR
jgi:hypothetical protein